MNNETIEICDKCGLEMAYEEYVGWWCPECDTISFGSEENCQSCIGIECKDCDYNKACLAKVA